MIKLILTRHEGCPLCKKLKQNGIPKGFDVVDEGDQPIDFMSLSAFYEIKSLPALIISEEMEVEGENGAKIKQEVWRIRVQGEEALKYAEQLIKEEQNGD